RTPSDEATAAARASLLKLTTNTPQLIELWSRTGDCVLSLPIPVSAATQLPKSSPPKAAGIGPFQLWHQVLYGETIVDGSAYDSGAAGRPRGLLILPPTLPPAPKAAAVNRPVCHGGSTTACYETDTAVDD